MPVNKRKHADLLLDFDADGHRIPQRYMIEYMNYNISDT